MTVTYKPLSRACLKPVPSFRGAVIRRDAMELHDSCDGTYDSPPMGPVKTGDQCACECHTPEGLPDWMRPQTGEALAEAIATEQRINDLTRHLEQHHPILGPGRLIDVMNELRNSCPELGGSGAEQPD